MKSRYDYQVDLRASDVPAALLWPSQQLQQLQRRLAQLEEEDSFGWGYSRVRGAIDDVKSQRIMEVLGGSEGKQILRDEDGGFWIAIPTDSIEVRTFADSMGHSPPPWGQQGQGPPASNPPVNDDQQQGRELEAYIERRYTETERWIEEHPVNEHEDSP